MTKMTRRSLPLILLLLSLPTTLSAAPAADGFEKVGCDRPIVPALVGARTGSSPVVGIEARRQSIGLKHLGAEEVGPGASTINWRICGRPFVVLDIRNVARDAVELPAYSREAPAFSTTSCEVGGRTIDGVFVGVFGKAASGGARRPVTAAWRVDTANGRFVLLDAGTRCATDGLYTADPAE